MAPTAAQPQKLTADEYLHRERDAEFKSEFWHGEVFAMAGVTENHGLICSNLTRFTQNRLDGMSCRVFQSDMKVGVRKKRGFAYPDLVVVCGDRVFYDEVRDVLVNPTAIFEVLSPSTRAFDLGRKFVEYQRFDTLRHYVVIEQDRRLVYHWTRQDFGKWDYEVLEGTDAVLRLHLIDLELPLSEIYYRVSLPETSGDEYP